jgi:hypothetical protein
MDDERIRQLTEDVLADLSRPAETDAPGVADLEARVAALEVTVRDLRGRRVSHPSLTILDLPSGSPQCLMEPDKPCVQSGACRTFGH